jgi:hypothetical protein
MIDLGFSVDVLGLLHNGSSAPRSGAAGRAPTPYFSSFYCLLGFVSRETTETPVRPLPVSRRGGRA